MTCKRSAYTLENTAVCVKQEELWPSGLRVGFLTLNSTDWTSVLR